MFRVWAKIFKDNRMIKDTVIETDDYSVSRTHRIFNALSDICIQFDLGNPIWLDSNIDDFKRHSKTKFRQDSFIENIDFDFLEIQIIEE